MAFSYSDTSFKPAGVWKDTMDQAEAIAKSSLPDAAKQEAFKALYSPDAQLAPFLGASLQQAAYNQTPEGRKQILQQQLEFDEARGKQQQNFRLINDSIASLGRATFSAFGGGRLSPEYLGQGMANLGNAYLSGLMAGGKSAPVVGQRYF